MNVRAQPRVDARTRVALAALLLAGTGFALLWWSGQTLDAAQHALDQTRGELARDAAALEAARQLDAALAPALLRWQALEATGAFALPEPLRWREGVVAVLRREGIDPAATELRFGAPRALEPAGGAAPAIVVSPLRLQVPLRHEGRLPPLLAALEALPGAVVATRGCTLERLPRPSEQHDRLRAECEFDGLTLALPSAAPAR